MFLGGGALAISACFGCLFATFGAGNRTNAALEGLGIVLGILAFVGLIASLVGVVLVLMRMLRALFEKKEVEQKQRKQPEQRGLRSGGNCKRLWGGKRLSGRQEGRTSLMKRTSRLALVAALGSLVALGAVVAAMAAPYERPASATPIQASLVPAFKQCGTPGNPSNSTHAAPLSVNSCNPPKPTSSSAVTGSSGSGSATLTVVTGDVQINLNDSDIQTPAGADYDPNPTTDLNASWRIRFTDTNNCTPTPCAGPYTAPGTGTDMDFGPVPVNCSVNGSASTPPGSTCNVATTANTVIPGSVVVGKEAVTQVFRIRVNDHLGALFQQQGIFIP